MTTANKPHIPLTLELDRDETFLRSIVDALPIGTIAIDELAVIQMVNSLAAGLYGYSASEMHGLSLEELFPEPESITYQERLTQFKATSKVSFANGSPTETRCRRKDGSIFDAEITPVEKTLGNARLFLMTVRDISDRNKTKAELRASEKRFREAMAGCSDAIYYLTAVTDDTGAVIDFEYTDVNQAGLDMMIFSREEMIGHRVSKLVPIIVNNGWLERYFHAYETGISIQDMVDVTAPQLKVKWMQHMVIPIEGGIVLQSRDISAQHAAQEIVKQSEESYRALVDASSDVVWHSDTEGRFTYISDRYAEITQQHADHLLGLNIPDGTQLNDSHTQWGLVRQALAARKPYRNLVISEVLQSGSTIYWSASGRPVFDEQGVFEGYRGTCLDVTDRIVAEEKLRLSEARMSDVVEASSDFIWEIDADGILVYISTKLEGLLGSNTQEMLGQLPWIIGKKCEDSLGWAEMRSAFERREPFRSLNTSMLYEDGSKLFWSNNGVPVFHEDGTFQGFRGSSSDITQRITAENRASLNARMLRGLRDNVSVGLATVDIDGQIQSFNPHAAEIFGYSQEEVIGSNIKMLMPKALAERFDAHISVFLAAGKSEIIGQGVREVTGRRKNGTEFPMDLTVSEMQVDDKRTFIGSFHDVTEKKMTEEQMRQAQRMEVVGQLTGGVAHDFNNILMGMQLNIEFLGLDVQGNTESEEYISHLQQSVNRAAGLTRQLLSFSRRQALSPTQVDVNQCMTDLTVMIRRTLEETVEIEVILQDDLGVVVVDSDQLESAILNLSINAHQAMPGGGKLTIETSSHTFSPDSPLKPTIVDPGKYIVVSVRDTGTGMDPDTIKRAFEPFFTTRDIGQGSGLGLSMVHGFVNQSGGHVVLESNSGVGTEVRLFFPQIETSD